MSSVDRLVSEPNDRLSEVRQLLREVAEMVESGSPPMLVIRQLLGIRTLVDEVGVKLLRQQVERCFGGSDPADTRGALEAIDLWSTGGKLDIEIENKKGRGRTCLKQELLL